MLIKDINPHSLDSERLIYDEEYYRYIFKKTEKIIGSVLYLLTTVPDFKGQNRLFADIETAAHQVHDLALKSLKDNPFSARWCLYELATAHIGLDSKLSLGRTTALLPPDLVFVLSAEIDSVLRHLSKYLKATDQSTKTKSETPRNSPVSTLSQDPGPPTNQTVIGSGKTSPVLQARRQQIVAALNGKGPISIKDISDSVVGCSSKTIQRELNYLIKDRIVVKIGDRRWSKYTLRQN